MKKIDIIIEARSTSSILKRKHLFKFQNKTLIEILIKRLKKLKKINRIILATTSNKEDDDLVKEAKKQKVLIFRGSENDVLGRIIKTCKKFNVKNICRITGDCPLIDISYIEILINNYLKNDLDYLSNGLSLPKGQGGSIFKFDALKNQKN